MSAGFPSATAFLRVAAALLAAVAVVALVHWHPLFEDGGADTLRDSANQCVACLTGGGPELVASATAVDLPLADRLEPAADPSAPESITLRLSGPRAPPL